MKSHISTLHTRMIRAALKVTECRYRVAAAGIDHRNRIIGIKVNSPKHVMRGDHAEERLMREMPRSLKRIVIIRVNSKGEMLPIDPCVTCARIADKLGVTIEKVEAPL